METKELKGKWVFTQKDPKWICGYLFEIFYKDFHTDYIFVWERDVQAKMDELSKRTDIFDLHVYAQMNIDYERGDKNVNGL